MMLEDLGRNRQTCAMPVVTRYVNRDVEVYSTRRTNLASIICADIIFEFNNPPSSSR
jgi:hypothetical protein